MHPEPASAGAPADGPDDAYEPEVAPARQWLGVTHPHLSVGEVTTVVAGGRAVCVIRTAEGWGALDNRCPHQGGPLGDGQLEGDFVICPWHAYEYDPVTGKPPPGFRDGATPYAVREMGPRTS